MAMAQCAETSQEHLCVVSDAAPTRPSLPGDADQATMRSTRRVHEDRADHELVGTRISHERYRPCMTGLKHAALFYCLRQCHHQSSAFKAPSDFFEAVIDGSAVLNDLVPRILERLGWWCSVDAELGRGYVVVVLSGGAV